MPSDPIYINKYKPKMLSTIQLTLIGVENIGSSGLRNLLRALKDNKRSSCLIIKNLYYWPYEDTRNIERLFAATSRWKTIKIFYNDQPIAPKPQEIETLTRLRRCKDLSDFELMLNCDEPNKNLIIQSLSKQFRGLNKIKNLSIDISSCDQAELMYELDEHYDENATLLTFQFPTSLSSLTLVFGGGYLDNMMLSKLTKNIQRCVSLEHLNLDISSLYNYLQQTEGEIWSSLFKKIQNLKTFTLNASWYSPMAVQGAKAFLGGLQNLKQLTTLNFKFWFSSSKSLAETFLHDLFHHLAPLPSLTSLNLEYLGLKLPKDPGFYNFFIDLKQLTRLQELNFSCSNCPTFDDTFLQHFPFALQYLQNLRKLHLLLSNSKVTDTGITSLSESLKELPHIQDLALNFSQCNLDYKSLEILSKGLANLSLTSFDLILGQQKNLLQQFVSFWKDKKELTSFSAALEKSHLLSTLSLSLSTFNIPAKEFKRFSCALKELKNLASLSLELPQFDSGNNFESFKSVAGALKELPKLKLLHIMTSRGAKLRDQEITFIMMNVRQCRSLENLKLNFEQVNLTDACLQHVLSGIKDLLALKNLYLGFGYDQRFTKGEVLKLLNGLAFLKELETLELRYPIDFEQNFRESRENLMFHQKLRHLTNFVVNEYF